MANDFNYDPVLDKLESIAKTLKIFKRVNGSEFKSAPGSGLNLAIFFNYLGPVAEASGQNSTTGRLEFIARIYGPFLADPGDLGERSMLRAGSALIKALHGDIDLGGNVKWVVILPASGPPLHARGGYMDFDRKMYRVVDVLIPLEINDLWNHEL